MGLLTLGTPLKWEDALKRSVKVDGKEVPLLKYVREHGIYQFLSIYNAVKDAKNDRLFWGDEIEYVVQRVDHKNKAVKLSLRAKEIQDSLNAKEKEFLGAGGKPIDASIWHPEYGSFMVESTPNVPYSGFTTDLLRVEENMRARRARLCHILQPDEIAPTISVFPMMGVGDFCSPTCRPTPTAEAGFSQSKWVPDQCINPHPRFGTLTQNIRKRRGQNVNIRIPLYQDAKTFTNTKRRKGMIRAIGHSNPDQVHGLEAESSSTPAAGAGGSASNGNASAASSSIELTSASEAKEGAAYDLWLAADDEIVMDCMAFGMGCCCLQVTFQARDVVESRQLYDLLIPFAPIMLALTAAAPIFKGQLADTDCRWNVISASVDDRTVQESGKHVPKAQEAELGEQRLHPAQAGQGKRRLRKSRYASVSQYINHYTGDDSSRDVKQYNDLDAPINNEAFATLTKNGVDETLARHIAHLFIRDPLVVYDERITIDDEADTDHFENLQSTNWQTLRWKPPPRISKSPKKKKRKTSAGSASSSEGDSAEPEAQSGAQIGWRVEFRSMELQLTDFENAAFSIFIVLCSRVILAFDLNTYIPLSKVDENMELAHRRNAVRNERFWFRRHLVVPEGGVPEYEDVAERMSVQQILMGKGTYFPGLIPMIFAYLDATGCDPDTRKRIEEYMRFVVKRATGQVCTTATFMRRFVQKHPDYEHDSVVTQNIAYDLMQECEQIGKGLKPAPELLGDHKIKPLNTLQPYPNLLAGDKITLSERDRLIKKYAGRCSFVENSPRVGPMDSSVANPLPSLQRI